jgi:hypothetical protein
MTTVLLFVLTCMRLEKHGRDFEESPSAKRLIIAIIYLNIFLPPLESIRVLNVFFLNHTL